VQPAKRRAKIKRVERRAGVFMVGGRKMWGVRGEAAGEAEG
jgi:hypothetical protein